MSDANCKYVFVYLLVYPNSLIPAGFHDVALSACDADKTCDIIYANDLNIYTYPIRQPVTGKIFPTVLAVLIWYK